MTASNGATPLTRFGSRVPATPISTPALTVVPSTAATPVVTPAPTIRTMIVCLPDGLPPQALRGTRLDRHFGVSGTLAALFWASKALHRWQHRHMFDLRKGRPAYCAGGPVSLLDLDGVRHAAGFGAGVRHTQWQHVVHGTPRANAWHVFQARYFSEPAKYPLARAEAEFWQQPRVSAMRLHNMNRPPAGQLPIEHLEMFEAGSATYQHYAAASTVCGDAMLTADGRIIAPAGDALSYRITYLDQATRHLGTIAPGEKLLAIAV